MAFTALPLHRLSVKQVQMLADQRRRNGFHVHYTAGFDASRGDFGFITPGYLWRGTSITTLFMYPAPSGLKAGDQTRYVISLGQYDKHLSSLVTLTFRGDTEAFVEHVINDRRQSGFDLIRRNMKGFHVLQFEANNSGLLVNVDGESVIPAGRVTNVADFTVFYTDSNLDYAPFVFFETHYTMDDVAAIINLPAWYNKNGDYTFGHTGASITVGGYALWNGTWAPKTRVEATGPNGRIGDRLEVPESGNLVALVKFYRNGCTFTNAKDSSKIPTLSNSHRSVAVGSLYISPNPRTLVEFKAVTGEIRY